MDEAEQERLRHKASRLASEAKKILSRDKKEDGTVPLASLGRALDLLEGSYDVTMQRLEAQQAQRRRSIVIAIATVVVVAIYLIVTRL